MRGNRIAVRSALSVAGLVALAACSSGSGTTSSAASSTSTASSSAAPTTAAAAAEFCKEATDTFTKLSPAFSNGSSDPASLAPALQQAEAKVRAIHPPAELAADWAELADSLQAFTGLYTGLHTGDPAAASSFAARNAALFASLGAAATHIQQYVAKNCGFTATTTGLPSGSAAPTS